jgi:hypothetical protein
LFPVWVTVVSRDVGKRWRRYRAVTMTPAPKSMTARRRRGSRALALCTAVLLVMCASVGGYVASREHTEQPSIVFGADDDEPNRVDITAWVTRVDVASQTATVFLADVTPRGALAQSDGAFAESAVLQTNSVQNEADTVKRGEPFPNLERRFSLTGVITDFPFDRYDSYLSLRMTSADGNEIPIAVTIVSTDAFFANTPRYDDEQSDWLNIDLGVKRSLPTIVFGVFVMVLMLGLSFAAALVAYFVVRSRQGVVFSAYSVMAALLFAMIPLRNAVPGNPPIGSLMDFVSFFIAEAVISVSLITSVVVSYRHQIEMDRANRQ